MTYQISLHSERGFAIHVYWHIYPVFVLICSLYGFLLCTLFLNNQVLYEVVKWVFKLIRWCSNFISTLISLYCNILIFTISMLTYVFFYQWRVVFLLISGGIDHIAIALSQLGAFLLALTWMHLASCIFYVVSMSICLISGEFRPITYSSFVLNVWCVNESCLLQCFNASFIHPLFGCFLGYTVMLTLRIYGYALAVSFCFITLIAASQRADPLECVFFI